MRGGRVFDEEEAVIETVASTIDEPEDFSVT